MDTIKNLMKANQELIDENEQMELEIKIYRAVSVIVPFIFALGFAILTR